MAVLIVAGFYTHIAWWAYVLPVFLLSLVIFYGSYYIGSNYYMPVTCRAQTDNKQIAITFDDGPVPNTPLILDVLKAQQVPAAFFCIGKRIAELPEVLQRIADEGHVIGNHSYSHHFFFDLYSSKKMQAELHATNATAKTASGKEPRLFRPPYGVMNPNLVRAIRRSNMLPIGWNIRSMDTVEKDAQHLLNKVLSKLQPGSIVLFHDTAGVTLDMLPEFIRQVRSNGYELVRLDRLLNTEAYA